jgi:acetoacetyl-CoA synthetase
MPGARWFPEARLNYAEHVLRGAATDRPAMLAVGEDHVPMGIFREELCGRVGAVGAALRERVVRPGDRVAAYAGNLTDTVVAMLATTSIGAVWTACAPDFGTKSVIDRFRQVEPGVLIAVDGYRFGGREYDRADTVRELLEALPSVRSTLLIRSLRTDAEPRAGESAGTGRGCPSPPM